MSSNIRGRLLLLAIVLFPGAYAQAQVGTAQVNGTIHDAAGKVIQKASITLHETSTNRMYTTLSNDNGFYAETSVIRRNLRSYGGGGWICARPPRRESR